MLLIRSGPYVQGLSKIQGHRKIHAEIDGQEQEFCCRKKSSITDVSNSGKVFEGTKFLEEYNYYPNSFHYEKGFEFHTFYHPFSGDYVTNLK